MSSSRKEIEKFLMGTSFALKSPAIMKALRCGFWMEYDEPCSNRSKLGGLPELPSVTEWPCSNGRPIEFLLQVFLSECSEYYTDEVEMPERGVLFFFYDFAELPLGDESLEAPGWRVLFVEDEDACGKMRQVDDRTNVYPEKRVDFFPTWSLPWAMLMTMCESDAQIDELHLLREEFDFFAQSFLGNSNPYQYHPGLICREATTGESWTETTEHEATLVVQDQWIQLAQLSSYPEELGWSWYAEGALYFMIHRDDLVARRFDRVRCCGQCS